MLRENAESFRGLPERPVPDIIYTFRAAEDIANYQILTKDRSVGDSLGTRQEAAGDSVFTFAETLQFANVQLASR